MSTAPPLVFSGIDQEPQIPTPDPAASSTEVIFLPPKG